MDLSLKQKHGFKKTKFNKKKKFQEPDLKKFKKKCNFNSRLNRRPNENQ